MRFVARPSQGDSLTVALSDAAFDRLVTMSRSPPIERLDPYQDTAFGGRGLEDLLEAVGSVLQSQVDAERERLVATAKLPKDSTVRDRILNDLLVRALESDGVAKELRELRAFLELAFEVSAVVHVDSD